ncbi:GlcG/HbpS family heme-binding protein [Actinomycetospora aeridis]|uniref:Heme-binding protein n=1 Tax=Actinomycetospora aeridis TaxID=3129231 RepID=A0ABU8N5U5_9PSEU
MNPLTAADARRVLDAAVAHAEQMPQPMVIAVVDAAAHLVAFLRMDGAILGSIDVAQRKARTSALFRTATGELHAAVAGPEAPLHGLDTTNRGLIVFGGGEPLLRDGEVIGAIGVSAGTAEQDTEVARAGTTAL